MAIDLAGLPAAETIEQGIRDFRAGRSSWQALLVASAASRLRELGVSLPKDTALAEEPELRLYRALGESCEDPYYRYNAVRGELDSFLAALQARQARAA